MVHLQALAYQGLKLELLLLISPAKLGTCLSLSLALCVSLSISLSPSHRLTFPLVSGGLLVTRIDVCGLNYCKLVVTSNVYLFLKIKNQMVL